MSIKKPGNAIGMINRKFPIWEFGADLYWHSSQPFRVQCPGGSGQWAYAYASVADSADYFVYDQGKQQFRLVDYAGTHEFPPNGFCPPDRTNLWDSNNLTDRGFQDFDTNLTHSHPTMSGTHILDVESLSWDSTLFVANDASTGSGLRFTRDESLSSTYNRVFAVLLKKPDGGVINSGVASLVVLPDGQLTSTDNLGNATKYTKVRSDGWYMLSTVCPNYDANPRMFGVQLEEGESVIVEYPHMAGTNTTPQIGVFQAPDIGTADETGIHQMQIARNAAGETTREPCGTAGWVGATVVHMYSNNGLSMPFGLYFNLAADGNNFLRGQYSTSTAHTAIEVDTNASDQLFLNYPDPVPSLSVGEKHGIVFTWGKRGSTKYGMYFLNGELIEVATNYTSMPSGVANWWDIGWDSQNASREPAACIQHFAAGHNLLTRSECRILSKWFQNQGLHGND
jgi:hypothetical protein